jgi:hypothetical protein
MQKKHRQKNGAQLKTEWQDQIPGSEWDFGKVESCWILTCLRWEAYRTALQRNEKLAAKVAKLRKTFIENEEFQEPPRPHKIGRFWDFAILLMLPSAVWPNQAFQQQDSAFLRRWRNFYASILEGDPDDLSEKLENQGHDGLRNFQVALGKFIDRDTDPLRVHSDPAVSNHSGWVTWPLEEIRKDEFSSPEGERRGEDTRSVYNELNRRKNKNTCTTVVALNINFQEPDTVIEKRFKDWLRRVRSLNITCEGLNASGVSHNRITGRMDHQRAEKELKNIGKWKLMDKLNSQSKAIQHLISVGATFYGTDPKNFSRSIREAKTLLNEAEEHIKDCIKRMS